MLCFLFFTAIFAAHNVRVMDNVLEEFQMVYKKIDTDNDGFVSVKEMKDFNNRRKLSEEDAAAVLDGGDGEMMKAGFAGNNTIQFSKIHKYRYEISVILATWFCKLRFWSKSQ